MSSESLLTQHRITVLLIDDQPMIGEAVRRMLAGENDILFHYCQDASSAFDQAVKIAPTVILQDLVMPEVDGLSLVKKFRAHEETREIPLIVLSTKEEAKTKAEAFGLGANDYLVKLPDRLELLARLRYHSRGYINLLERNEAYKALLESQKRLAKDVAEAARYVRSILPEPLCRGEITTDWRFIPSANLGGDAFGYNWIDDDHFAFYLLDVSGHGVGPALLSVSVLNALRSQSLAQTDFSNPGQVLTALNKAFPMDQQNGMFFTIWYGIYDQKTRTIDYSGAGHPPALLITGSGAESSVMNQLRSTGAMVGAIADLEYRSSSCKVGDFGQMFLYSDGVFEIERADGTMWPLDEFIAFMSQRSRQSSSSVEQVLAHVRMLGRRDEFKDDFSIVEIQFGRA